MQLSFLGNTGEGEFLFRLTSDNDDGQEAALRRQFAVTQREAEVLLWIARGKSNRDIGEILGLSPRTVNKHLEQIYTKLGVENRASAAVVAMTAIGGALKPAFERQKPPLLRHPVRREAATMSDLARRRKHHGKELHNRDHRRTR